MSLWIDVVFMAVWMRDVSKVGRSDLVSLGKELEIKAIHVLFF